ncbi:MAG: microcystin-dependent protein [Gammaproteobacteria bacterium]|jgi:microcystin-dependent protein
MKTLRYSLAAASIALASLTSPSTHAQSDPYLGEIMAFGATFCPRGWAEANGQILPISPYSALYSLYGTTYGGDGRTSMGLPDLRGRVPIHMGQGPGLSDRRDGSRGGSESVTLTPNHMGQHNHTLHATSDVADTTDADTSGAVLAQANIYTYADSDAEMARSITKSGGFQSHNNMPPYQVVRYCVALVGTYPSRN